MCQASPSPRLSPRRALRALLAGAALWGCVSTSLQAAELTGAGSTFAYPVISAWSSRYHELTGDKLNYQSIGSGGGIAQIQAGTVDFGVSDMPLEASELRRYGLGQFPLVVGGVVPVVHLPGIAPGGIRFSGAVLAAIYMGHITQWNDPALVALNPGVPLPEVPIVVVHRSDASGTTFNWTHYLSAASDDWKAKMGQGTALSWPVGIGGKGNEGVAAYVERIPNAIGYVEYTFVAQNHMTFGLVQNRAGAFVGPDIASFQAAAEGAQWHAEDEFHTIITNASGAGAYPIAATVFVLAYKHPQDMARQKVGLEFFRWALESGASQATALHYVPLPTVLVKQIEAYWAEEFGPAS